MGYAFYTVYRNGQKIEAGYGVDDTCNEPGCSTPIDRGLDHLCGETPGGDEWGCGHYFCSEHFHIDLDLEDAEDRGEAPLRCASCIEAAWKHITEGSTV